MDKKEYIQPSITIVNLKPAQMLATSNDVRGRSVYDTNANDDDDVL